MRGLILILAMPLLGACTFSWEGLPNDEVTVPSVERAEVARDRSARLPAECRDDRVDRRDQGDGCREVVRRR